MKRLHQIALFGFSLLFSGLVQGQTTVNLNTTTGLEDAMVGNGGIEQMNFGSQDEMRVYYNHSQQISNTFRTFLEFDMSSIPDNALIMSAELTLYPKQIDNAEDHPIYIARVTSDGSWAESTINWDNQPDVKADRLSFTHAQTTNTTEHNFDVEDHVQYMVNNPLVNHGWRIRLQQEQGNNSHGIVYHSSEATDVAKRPKLTVEYMLPITCTTEVVHNTAGNTDASLTATIGGGTVLRAIVVYKDEEVAGDPGNITRTLVARLFPDGTTSSNATYNTTTRVFTANNLEPGSYLMLLTDYHRHLTGDPKFSAHHRFLVGREGETTECLIGPGYIDNVTLQRDKPTATNPLDRENTNYALDHTKLRIADNPNLYEFASLTRYRCDFDDKLEFSKADLKIDADYRFIRFANSSNAVDYNVLTSDWNFQSVTWNTRPGSDPAVFVHTPNSEHIGQSHTPRSEIDTVSLLNLIAHWQDNPTPSGNYGFEMVLDTYGQSEYAQRTYVSSYQLRKNYLRLEFTVKEPISSTFDDASNTGTITVNAPDGDLPYTYLISQAPIGTLQSIWDAIKDSTFVDSADFFQGDINSKSYQFEDLTSDEYYVAVFDNNGVKIQDESILVNTEVIFASATGLTISSDRLIERVVGASGTTSARIQAELMKDSDWGGIQFEVDQLDEMYIGFNATPNTEATTTADFDFGLKIESNGGYRIIRNGVEGAVLGQVTVGSKVTLDKSFGNYVAFIDNSEVYNSTFSELESKNLFIDVVLVGTSGKLKVRKFKGGFRRVGIASKITYPECGQFSGDLTVGLGFFVASSSNCTLTNNNPSGESFVGTLSSGVYTFSDVPIGTYTLTTTLTGSPLFGSPVHVTTEQVAIGYVVEWENLYYTSVTPLNTIQQSSVLPIPPSGGHVVSTANSTNMTVVGYPNWVQFETEFPSSLLYAIAFPDNRREKLKLTNQSGENAFQFQLAAGGINYTSGQVSTILSSGMLNAVWRIDQASSSYALHKDGTLVDNGNIAPGVDAPYHIAIEQVGNPRYIKTIASFCSSPIIEQYVQPKRSLEGGYFLVPQDDILRFEFTEEYVPDTTTPTADNLSYIVRDFTGTDLTGGLSTDFDEIFGDNRFSLDVSSLAEGYYVMEIKNQKGEDWFIRFKVQ